MKNIVLSAVAVLAMSSFAVAGGDIAPVEEPMVVPEPVVTDSGLYLGLAYGWQSMVGEDEVSRDNQNGSSVLLRQTWLDESAGSIMLQAGYKFNSYVAIEGRYWFGLDTTTDDFWDDTTPDADVSIDSFGIYVKPMYPVTDAFDIYALLGYGSSELTATFVGNNAFAKFESDNADGFSWGIGAAYSFSDTLAVFVDYVDIYDSGFDVEYGNSSYERDFDIDTVNFGLTYQF